MMEVHKNLDQAKVNQDIMKEFITFIQTFEDPLNEGQLKYPPRAKDAILNSKRHVDFDFKDVVAYNSDLAKHIFDDYYRYEPVINEALTHFMT